MMSMKLRHSPPPARTAVAYPPRQAVTPFLYSGIHDTHPHVFMVWVHRRQMSAVGKTEPISLLERQIELDAERHHVLVRDHLRHRRVRLALI